MGMRLDIEAIEARLTYGERNKSTTFPCGAWSANDIRALLAEVRALRARAEAAEAEHTRLRKQNGILAARAAELHEIVGAAKVSFEGLKDARTLSRACHAYVVNAMTEDGCRWCSPNGEMDDPDAHAEWCPVRLAINLRFALIGDDVAWRVLERASESLERGKPQPGREE